MRIFKGDDRGRGDYGRIRSRHSFSFGQYHDPERMGLSHLRVLNDDWVAPGAGFPPHGHHDMEIISYVTGGVMEHVDSLGNRFRIDAGQFQAMSAGTGIRHSEYNASTEEPLTFLQVWIEPEATGLAPGYAPPYAPPAEHGRWLPVAGPADAPLVINQDVELALARLDRSDRLDVAVGGGYQAYIHVVRGRIECDGNAVAGGDALVLNGPATLVARGDSELLRFDLPR